MRKYLFPKNRLDLYTMKLLCPSLGVRDELKVYFYSIKGIYSDSGRSASSCLLSVLCWKKEWWNHHPSGWNQKGLNRDLSGIQPIMDNLNLINSDKKIGGSLTAYAHFKNGIYWWKTIFSKPWRATDQH